VENIQEAKEELEKRGLWHWQIKGLVGPLGSSCKTVRQCDRVTPSRLVLLQQDRYTKLRVASSKWRVASDKMRFHSPLLTLQRSFHGRTVHWTLVVLGFAYC
jgi:hypothetical protein